MSDNRGDMKTTTLWQRMRRRLLEVREAQPLDLARVLELEDRHFIRADGTRQGSAGDRLTEAVRTCHERDRAALCLSRCNLIGKFHYLSTVSGGGYAGSWLSAWLLHEKERADATKDPAGCADVVSKKLGGSAGGPDPDR